ncbi:transposase, MuDR, MULE transposase domain protein, partial [Tanacetum coccineum]
VEDVGEDADFNSEAWVSATNYVNAFGGTVTGCLGDIDNFLKKGKLEQLVAIVKSCSPNALGDLNVTLKDLSGTVPRTIHYKVLDVSSYEKDITVGAAMILANVSIFTHKPSKHYLNITKRNVVEVFQSDTASIDHLSNGEKEVLEVRTKKVGHAPKNKATKMFDENSLTSIFSWLPEDDFDDNKDPKTNDQDNLDFVMSSASTDTYTSVYTDSEPGRVFWGADEDLSDGGSPRVIVYGYDGLPMQPVAPPSLDYVPGPEHPLSPDYVSGPEHPPSPVEEDPEENHADYPADEGDDDDEPSDDDTNDEDEEPFEDKDDDEEEEEHLAPADSSVIPVVDPIPSAGDTKAFETDEEKEVERLLALPPPPPSPFISLSPPSAEERLARCLAAPALPSSPLHIVPHPYGSPNHMRAPPGFRAAMGRLRASSPSTHHPLHPSPPLPPPPPSLHLPPHVPTSLPLPSSPLPPLRASLFIPLPVDRREDILEAELPPRKRLCLTALTSRYEVEESLTAAPKPTGCHRANYGFIGTMDAEIRRQRAEEVGYGIRDVWVDLTEAVEEVAPTTLEGVNARVTELATVQEQDTQDIYAVIEDTHDRHTQLFQRVEGLVDITTRNFHQCNYLSIKLDAMCYPSII